MVFFNIIPNIKIKDRNIEREYILRKSCVYGTFCDLSATKEEI